MVAYLRELRDERGRRRDAPVALLDAHPANDRRKRGIDFRVYVANVRERIRGKRLHEDLRRVWPVVRHLARDHLEENDSERVYVSADIHRRRVERLLWGDVCGCSEDAFRLGAERVAQAIGLRYAEVDELDRAVGLDHYVLGLYVAVHDVVFLRRVESRRHLQNDLHGAGGRELSGEGERLPEVSARDVVHHDEVDAARLVKAAVVHRHEVGVAYARRYLRLAQKTLYVVGVLLRDIREKRLERIDGVEQLVPHEVNGAERAVAEKPFYDVAAELVARVENLRLAEVHPAPPILTTTAE